MKAYSIDLRQKIIETYEQESISQRKLAERFRVAPSFIYKLLKQYKEKGTLEPKGHGGGQGLKLRSEEVIILTELVADKNDATLAELKEKLYGVFCINPRKGGLRVLRLRGGKFRQVGVWVANVQRVPLRNKRSLFSRTYLRLHP